MGKIRIFKLRSPHLPTKVHIPKKKKKKKYKPDYLEEYYEDLLMYYEGEDKDE